MDFFFLKKVIFHVLVFLCCGIFKVLSLSRNAWRNFFLAGIGVEFLCVFFVECTRDELRFFILPGEGGKECGGTWRR